MATHLIGKVLTIITMGWGIFLLFVYWTSYFELDIISDEDILYMACLNSISFTAITVGFFFFQFQSDSRVVISPQ
jgi:hypothetical protein